MRCCENEIAKGSIQMQERHDRGSRYSGAATGQPTREVARIDLTELLYKFLSSWKRILGIALLLSLLMGVYSFCLATPVYEATATIYVLNPSDSAINLSQLQLGAALAQDYIKIFNMWNVHEMVLTNLDLPYTYDQISSMLRVTNDANTRMLDITVRSVSPAEAKRIADEYARVVSVFIAEKLATDKPTTVADALQPTKPVSPNKTKNILFGFVAGTLIGCAWVFIRMVMDDKIRTPDDVLRYTGLPTLAIVPMEQGEAEHGARRSA